VVETARIANAIKPISVAEKEPPSTFRWIPTRSRFSRLRNFVNLDTKSPTGRALLNLVGSVAQFEREIMLERQREGISKAKSEGKYKGRAPTALAKSDKVIAMFKVDKKPTTIARLVGIGRASGYRILVRRDLLNRV
jgi:DNA invertase Pin-like site-specific DNA recombinase